MGKNGQWNEEAFNDSEKFVLSYIYEHIDEIPELSSRELARKTATNPTLILRFSKKLGFKNFNDFKMNIGMKLKLGNFEDSHIKKSELPITITNKIGKLYEQTIQETINHIPINLIKQVSFELDQVLYIDFIATDLNASSCEYAASLFMRVGKICQIFSEKTKQLLLLKNINKQHFVILISKTGKNEMIIEIAKELRKRNIKTLSITSSNNQLLKRICDYQMTGVYNNESYKSMNEITFQMSIHYIMTLLYAMLFTMNYDDVVSMNDEFVKSFYEYD